MGGMRCIPIGGHDPKSGLAAFNEIRTKFYALYPQIAEACTQNSFLMAFFDPAPAFHTRFETLLAFNNTIWSSTVFQPSY
jgi:hypothetical protein